MTAKISIKSIMLENVRGFSETYFSLDRENLIFVGANNTGKTSILIILEWILNRINSDYLKSGSALHEEWMDILLPARETRNRARRITLELDIGDGRKKRKYADESGAVKLRFNLRLAPGRVVVRLGSATRGELFENDSKALDLIDDLQEAFSFHYVSPYRGNNQETLEKSLSNAFGSGLSGWFGSLGGRAQKRQEVIKLLEDISRISYREISPIVDKIIGIMPNGMAPKTYLEPNINQKTFFKYLAEQADLKLSTGDHDSQFVKPGKVGSGLRSLLELAVQAEPRRGSTTVIAIEEPEAYLHPMAQRMLAKELLELPVHQRMISTHSPIFVEESSLADVVIVKDHQFFPSTISDERMSEIGSALLKKHGAEVLFAGSVLLVEGESDYFFFEILRERLLQLDNSAKLVGLHVLPVGGKEQFCPYVKLIDAFGETSHPIAWRIVADNDAFKQLKDIAKNLDISLGQEVREKISEVARAFSAKNASSWRQNTTELNELLRQSGVNIFLMPGDLEYELLVKASTGLLSELKQKLKMEKSKTREDVLKKLGSKGIDCKCVSEPFKAPYIRAYIARQITAKELSTNVRRVLYSWACPLGVQEPEMEALIKRL